MSLPLDYVRTVCPLVVCLTVACADTIRLDSYDHLVAMHSMLVAVLPAGLQLFTPKPEDRSRVVREGSTVVRFALSALLAYLLKSVAYHNSGWVHGLSDRARSVGWGGCCGLSDNMRPGGRNISEDVYVGVRLSHTRFPILMTPV